MQKLISLSVVALMAGVLQAGSIPAQITYQGTLRKSTVPITGPVDLTFNIYNGPSTNTTPLWSTQITGVPVNQGLFSVTLTPTGIDWQNTTPYIAVGVGTPPQMLGPSEPITATIYAVMAESVVDGSITPQKINTTAFQAAGPGLVPQGAIMMFDQSCPNGWTRFAALDGLFPVGNSSYGGTGGSATHVHSISTDGAHNHGGFTGQGDSPGISDAGANFGNQNGWHRHPISMDGSHNHGGITGSSSNLPPYMDMVFCKKQ